VTAERDPSTEVALATLVAVGRRLAAADRLWPTQPEPLLQAVAATAASIMDAQAASIALHDPATDRLVFVAAAGPAGDDVVGLAIESTAGIAGYAFATGQPLAIADVAQDPRFDRTIAESTGYVPRSLLATPLVDDQGALGVLEILDRRTGTFDLRDLEVAATLARQATVIARHGRADRDATRLLRTSLVTMVTTRCGAWPTGSPALSGRIPTSSNWRSSGSTRSSAERTAGGADGSGAGDRPGPGLERGLRG
jgi:signal transduction protein with GAF and PtsI domain